jgi:beta-phosphoglucomutase-like phosphatase (HAD superfamily)
MLALRDQVDAALAAARRTGWDGLVAAQREYLDEVWGCADVELEGDPELQQAVRFGLFHVVQSAARAEARGIPAKGLTGRGYDGHTFWDMEAYVLPVLTYSSPGAARDALLWRHRTLGQATARARELRLAGAAFPWRTIRGEECSGYWPAGTAAFHINANIAEAVRRYVAATDDAAFEGGPGLELFVGTARLWRSLGHHDAEGRFRIDGVTGPDEYTALVNNNTFTNLMAARNLRAAADAASRHPTEASALDVDDDELASWHTAADAMVIPFDSELGVTSQSEGFTRFRRWDFGATGADEYPLLLHFPYYLLYSSQVVKQADLVFALYACGDHFTPEQKRRDFEYYEAITVRDSSLSACIQAIVAAEVGHLDLAYEYFRETALVDLRNLAGNTAAGVHLGSLAGAWLVAVAGFGGLRDQDGTLAFAPRLPPSLESVRFRVRYRGRRLAVAIGRDGIRYELLAGEPLEVLHEGQPILLVAGSPQEQPCSPPPAVTPVRPPPGCEPSYADVDARSSRDRPAAGRRFRGGIFDVDGVLVDSPHEKAWREALRELMEGEWSEIRDRTTWSPDAFTSLVYREAISGKPRMSGARAALQYFHVPDDEEESRVARYAERKHSIVERLIGAGDFTAYRDALGFIIAVKDAGLRLAAASSSKNAKLLLSRIRLDTFANENGISSRSVRPGLSLLDYFDVDVSGLDFTHGKPDPEMFLTAAQELGVTPEESVVVEDAAAGIEAAKAGRMAAIGIARADDADLLAEAGADLVVSSLDQVDVGALARGLLATRGPGPGHPRDDARAGGRAAETRARPGGAATVDEMSEWSFPASDPPATWTWEVP